MEVDISRSTPIRVGKKMRKRRELDALVSPSMKRCTNRLLSGSSDEGDQQSRGRAGRRKRRCPSPAKLAITFLVCMCFMTSISLAWIYLDVRGELNSMQIRLARVTTHSDSIGDQVQKTQSATTDLKTNLTELTNRIATLSASQDTLRNTLTDLTTKINAFNDSLLAMRSEFEGLKTTVGGLQSNSTAEIKNMINDMNSSFVVRFTQMDSDMKGFKEEVNELGRRTRTEMAKIVASIRKLNQTSSNQVPNETSSNTTVTPLNTTTPESVTLDKDSTVKPL